MHAQPGQPDHHARGARTPDGKEGRASEAKAADHEAEESAGRRSLRDDQARDERGLLFVQRTRRGAGGDEFDHPGLQPQTGAEHPGRGGVDRGAQNDVGGRVSGPARAFFQAATPKPFPAG